MVFDSKSLIEDYEWREYKMRQDIEAQDINSNAYIVKNADKMSNEELKARGYYKD